MSFQSFITAAVAYGVLAGSSHAVTIFGLGAGGQLYRFDSATPGTVSAVGSPLAGGIVDIDYRGSNNTLYGISGSGSTYSINTAVGTSIGTRQIADGAMITVDGVAGTVEIEA